MFGKKAEIQEKKPSGFSLLLNKYFHHIDRGSTTGREIGVGIFIALLSLCGLFMNMQLISQMFVVPYASATTAELATGCDMIAAYYFISVFVAFVGSLLIGLIARLPLVQTSSLGLATVLVSLIGTKSGLSYSNLLVICFISSILLAVLVSVPPVKKFLNSGIPASVRKAVRAAMGLMIAVVALQLSGVVTFSSSLLPIFGIGQTMTGAASGVVSSNFINFSLFNYSNDPYHPTLMIAGICAVLAVILVFVFKMLKLKHSYAWSLIASTVIFFVFYILLVCINWDMGSFSTDTLWARLWMVGSEDAQITHMGAIFSNMGIGKVFSEGFDFTAYTEAGGNVFLLLLTGVLTMLFSMLAFNDSVAEEVLADNEDLLKDMQKANWINAGVNVIAPIFSVAPVSYSAENLIGKEEGAKSGLSNCAASVIYLISMFFWIAPCVLATATNPDVQMNMYGHYGTTLQYLTNCSFSIVDVLMVIAGSIMFVKNLDIDYKNVKEVLPFFVTLILAFVTSNIAYGALLGIACHVCMSLLSKPEEGHTRLEGLTISHYILSVLGVLVFALSLCL